MPRTASRIIGPSFKSCVTFVCDVEEALAGGGGGGGGAGAGGFSAPGTAEVDLTGTGTDAVVVFVTGLGGIAAVPVVRGVVGGSLPLVAPICCADTKEKEPTAC